MKKNSLVVIGKIHVTFLTLLLVYQTNIDISAQSLNYTQSNSGLQNENWGLFYSEIEFADVNADGHQDIISIGDCNSPDWGIHGIMVYFGDGAGHWSLSMNGNFGYGGIAAGDVNNDGFMDVGYGMRNNNPADDFGDQTLEVALGDGSGINWVPWDDGLGNTGSAAKMFAADFADVDNDGDLDIGSTSPDGLTGTQIYLNNSDGTWVQSFQCASAGAYDVFRFGDLNNDGFMDFVTDSDLGTAYFGDGTGGFIHNDQGLPTLDSLKRRGISIGDVNNDGSADLAFTNYLEYHETGQLNVYVFDKLQQQWNDFSGNLPDGYPDSYDLTDISDMNMDGIADLVAMDVFGSSGRFTVFLGDGNSQWQETASVYLPDNTAVALDLTAGRDVDHNGYPDILMLKTIEQAVMEYYNIPDLYRESSEPSSLSVKPVFPQGHELIFQNSIRNIEWVSAVPAGEMSQIRLEYSVNGPDGPWILIAGNLPDNGCYQWNFPEVVSTDCYIRYTVFRGREESQCVSPAGFSITDGTLGLDENDKKVAHIQVYPNPANCQLKISSSLPLSDFDVIDLYGRTIGKFRDEGSSPVMIDISGFSDGIYFIRMNMVDGSAETARFIKVSQ